jgi:hypothetical protein
MTPPIQLFYANARIRLDANACPMSLIAGSLGLPSLYCRSARRYQSDIAINIMTPRVLCMSVKLPSLQGLILSETAAHSPTLLVSGDERAKASETAQISIYSSYLVWKVNASMRCGAQCTISPLTLLPTSYIHHPLTQPKLTSARASSTQKGSNERSINPTLPFILVALRRP